MNEIISNGLKFLTDLARTEIYKKAYETTEQITYLNTQTGITSEIDKHETPISHTLADIQSLCQMLKQFEERRPAPATFVSPTEIMSIVDYNGFRVNSIRVPLTQSPILAFVSRQTTGTPKEIIRALQFNLGSAVFYPEPIPAIQTLRFESSKEVNHENRDQDEAVGMHLKARVTGSEAIPRKFTVMFEMYPSIADDLDSDSKARVEMELHVNPSEGTVSIRPFPGTIEEQTVIATRSIRNAIIGQMNGLKLEEAAAMVFLGKP